MKIKMINYINNVAYFYILSLSSSIFLRDATQSGIEIIVKLMVSRTASISVDSTVGGSKRTGIDDSVVLGLFSPPPPPPFKPRRT